MKWYHHENVFHRLYYMVYTIITTSNKSALPFRWYKTSIWMKTRFFLHLFLYKWIGLWTINRKSALFRYIVKYKLLGWETEWIRIFNFISSQQIGQCFENKHPFCFNCLNFAQIFLHKINMANVTRNLHRWTRALVNSIYKGTMVMIDECVEYKSWWDLQHYMCHRRDNPRVWKSSIVLKK